MEYKLSCFAFGTYPGRENEEKNFAGEKLELGDENDRLKDLSSSDENLILIQQRGKSKACGKNINGTLGIGCKEDTKEMKEVKSTENFQKSKAGKYFSFWINDKQQLFVAGTSNEYLEPTLFDLYKVISFDLFEKSAVLQVSEDSFVFYDDFEKDTNEKHDEIKMPDKIKEVSCGNGFCSILLENELLFKYGPEKEIVPIVVQRIVMDGGNRFLSASCSMNYIAVVDINGGVWILGKMGNYNGEEALIPIMQDAVKVRAFPTHCVIFDGFGLCFSFGSNESGQLGNGTLCECFSPMPMDQSDAAFDAIGGKEFTILLPLDFTEDYSKYYDEDVIPGSLAKTLQNPANFVPQ